MTDTLEQRARELLADAYQAAGWENEAQFIRAWRGRGNEIALSAIAAALQAQQPDLTNEVIREGKAQWNRVAAILGADEDCVDSVIAAAERLAKGER